MDAVCEPHTAATECEKKEAARHVATAEQQVEAREGRRHDGGSCGRTPTLNGLVPFIEWRMGCAMVGVVRQATTAADANATQRLLSHKGWSWGLYANNKCKVTSLLRQERDERKGSL